MVRTRFLETKHCGTPSLGVIAPYPTLRPAPFRQRGYLHAMVNKAVKEINDGLPAQLP